MEFLSGLHPSSENKIYFYETMEIVNSDFDCCKCHSFVWIFFQKNRGRKEKI